MTESIDYNEVYDSLVRQFAERNSELVVSHGIDERTFHVRDNNNHEVSFRVADLPHFLTDDALCGLYVLHAVREFAAVDGDRVE